MSLRRGLVLLPRLGSFCQSLMRGLHSSPPPFQTDPVKQYDQQKKLNEEAGELTELVRDFLDPATFFNQLRGIDINFFCGVPDSLLKDFCAYVTNNVSKENHLITANEGSAVALATGYHLATGKAAMVYLQNSGLGNTVNPLMSLAVPAVYSIPMLMLIGWRGEPGKRDEPQHITQGKTTPGLLAALGIPFQPLPDYEEGAGLVLQSARHYLDSHKGPYALLVRRQTFSPYKLPKLPPVFPLSREKALQLIIDGLGPKDVIVGTTGMLSRELYEYRVAREDGHERDFLTVGSMGHASSIALGIAIQKHNRQIICLDGDGSVIMHMGALATIGQHGPENLKHVIINNGSHDSVGGQPTDAGNHDNFNFGAIARGCGYREAFVAITQEEVIKGIAKLRAAKGPVLLEIKTRTGARKDLGRPKTKPLENKDDFMHFLALSK
ncbi:phosphonopyruvate decarboxylase-like isoform X4 [Dreissena polymorpha]|nr:phosphonopyruvate decarboxylase-like isoform X4 [Dreissena polymorpha]XP_052234545.1 phosphonopyruvate decarboxylase-like isoform X4 [Dreissena polymorpha]XP_052234546.1 phosphonopyruvate decarboxylase-like isoform X4 [Dreissena polymorpha]XP_052234547.1 phosphonopyruvate decarboxylase-like isoform X4 [Dreissena polymorpha]XP_052234548.1 phosphonopyruvate decarboxylase-like isoform X4 [Dreissena polymorpha]